MTYRGLISTTVLRRRGKVSGLFCVYSRIVITVWRKARISSVKNNKTKCHSMIISFGSQIKILYSGESLPHELWLKRQYAVFSSFPLLILSSLWPAVFRCGRDIWALAQFIVERCAVHLQRAGGAAHPGAVETSPHGQPGHLLCQFIPGLFFTKLCYPGPGAVSQMENSHRRVRRQHRWLSYDVGA